MAVPGLNILASTRQHGLIHLTMILPSTLAPSPPTPPDAHITRVRGRHKHDEAHGPPPETPEGFWELSFADSISRKEQERAAAADAQTGGARSAQHQADSLGF